MFAPKAGSTTTLRNPRRRQRTSSGESIKAPSAKRQRSILSQDNNPNTGDLTYGAPNHRSSIPTATTEVDSTPAPDGENQKNIPIRTFNATEKRKSDVLSPIILVSPFLLYSFLRMLTLVQSKTDFYTVSQLPCLPDQIRNLRSGTSSPKYIH